SDKFRVNFYLSPDAKIDQFDQPLGSAEVDGVGAGLTSPTLTETFPILGTQAPGNYTVGMIIDPDDALNEQNRDDNSNLGSGTDSAALQIATGGGTPTGQPLAGPGKKYFAVGPGAGA